MEHSDDRRQDTFLLAQQDYHVASRVANDWHGFTVRDNVTLRIAGLGRAPRFDGIDFLA